MSNAASDPSSAEDLHDAEPFRMNRTAYRVGYGGTATERATLGDTAPP
jgi:hypothetical protein